ncbi:hypothetical protein CR513_30496, partial [Mucuna pruriens]
MVHIREYATKARVVKRYNSTVFPRPLQKGDLVLKRILKGVATNKLTPNWEGPFRLVTARDTKTYERQLVDDCLGH